MDPWGYEEGEGLTEDMAHLVSTGDYLATFMGWLSKVPAGGATGFIGHNNEIALCPEEGSAAFWINLSTSHGKDKRTNHGGCPVIIGSKWIINKWIYSFDQWRDWPCSKNEDTFFYIDKHWPHLHYKHSP